MSDAPLMLSVSGLRGIVGKSLTTDIVTGFAMNFGNWLAESTPRPKVIIGRDGRAGGLEMHQAAIEGLVQAGCEVTDIDIAMTPTVGVMVDYLNAAGGMVVTASHNPQIWNGLKCLVPGHAGPAGTAACAPAGATASHIIERYQSTTPKPASQRGEVTEHKHATILHVQRVLDELDKHPGLINDIQDRRFRIVLDSVNASGAQPGRMLLEKLGCELVHEGADSSGHFPHLPEPTKENLSRLCNLVQEHDAAAGFAQDPDGDRLAIVDDHGQYIGEEYTLVLCAKSLLKTEIHTGDAQVVFCTNLSTSRMIEDVAHEHKARLIRTPVGEANVVETMKLESLAGADVVLGGEGNGGVIWPQITYVRDSLSSMALVLALMAQSHQSISKLVADVPQYSIQKRKKPLPDRAAAAGAIEALAAHYSHTKNLDRQDGLRVDLPESRAWLHVRPSNTEPILRLIAEAPEALAAAELLDEAEEIIAGWRD